ncbi:MAG TPA: protein-methionine-sulfoxide reductase heme-binding subunit MsrQ [Armatimonadota bacterium]
MRFARFVLFVNCLVPGALLSWDAYHHRAGANPVNYALRTTGFLTLTFVALTLLVTPARKLTRLSWLYHFRRPLGLFAFSYAVTHFTVFFAFDRAMSLRSTISEMVKRPYLIVGSAGLLAMVPLAATSTNAMIKRLGPKRWQALHRLVYFTAIAGVVHFYMLVKSDHRLPVAFGVVMAALLGYRLVSLIQGRTRRRERAQLHPSRT